MCVAFVLSLFLTVLTFALGLWLIGLLLGPVAVVLGMLWVSAVWDDLEPRLREATLTASDAAWRSARVVRVSLASWSRAGKVEVQTRARQHGLYRQRDALLRSLGEAVFDENEELAAELKRSVASTIALIEQNELERSLAWDSAGERVDEERSATAPTESFEVRARAESERSPSS